MNDTPQVKLYLFTNLERTTIHISVTDIPIFIRDIHYTSARLKIGPDPAHNKILAQSSPNAFAICWSCSGLSRICPNSVGTGMLCLTLAIVSSPITVRPRGRRSYRNIHALITRILSFRSTWVRSCNCGWWAASSMVLI